MAGVDILATAMTGANAAYLADLYARWAEKPDSVDPSMAELFAALNDEARAVLTDATGASWAPRVRGAFGPEPSEAELRPLRLAGTAPGPARWTIVQARALHQLPRLAATVLASLLVGAVVVENVFYLPGLGRQVLGAALAHDLPGLRASLFLLIAIGGLLLLIGTLGRLATDHQLRGTP